MGLSSSLVAASDTADEGNSLTRPLKTLVPPRSSTQPGLSHPQADCLGDSQPFAGKISFPPSMSDRVTHSPCPRLTQMHTGTGFLRISIRKKNGGSVGSGVIPTVKRRDSKPQSVGAESGVSVLCHFHTQNSDFPGRFPSQNPCLL